MAAYARGPFAHLVAGTIEQNVLFHVMLHAMTAGAGGEAAPTPAAAEGTDASGAAMGEEGSSENTVEEEASDAIDGLPADATTEPLEDAAAEDEATEGTTAP